MGIREALNNSPRLTVGAVTALAVLATGFVVMQVLAGRRTFPSKVPDSFFSTDDGKTFFVASSENVPPFDYKGKLAVHAYVFECRGKRFVGFLERYSDSGRAAILAGKRSPETERFGRELKKPGDPIWVKSGDLATEAKVSSNIRCPDGHPDVPEAVEP